MGNVIYRPPWNEDAMAAGYWLALLPTLGMLVGAGAAVLHWYRRQSLSWLLILGLAFAMLFGLIHLNLSVPFIASPKIFYGLSAMICLCACGGWGLDLLAGRRRWSSVLVLMFLSAWAGNSYLTYWIDGDAPRTSWLLTRDSDQPRARDAADALKAAVERSPADAEAQFFLGVIHKESGDQESAVKHFEESLRLNPRNVESRLEICAHVYREQGLDAAIELLEGIPSGSSASAEYFRLLGQLHEQRGGYDAALEAYRHAVAVDPLVSVTHRLLAGVYARLGDERRVNEHADYATRLDR